MDRPVRIALFGVVEADGIGGRTPVAGLKLQLLVAMLALAAPHPVPDTQLIEGLWGDERRADPLNGLQALVLVLRKLVGRDVVIRRSGGYLIDVGIDDIDVHRVERLVRDGHQAATGGDHRGASTAYAEAVDLARGPLLAALADHDFARAASARLDELVLAAHHGLVDAELASGRHADVVPMLTSLVDAHPLRERFHAQLMTALYRCGRQSEALRTYRHARTILVRDVGVEPGPELKALERAVLTHDPALSAPATVHVAATPPRPAVALTSFVGRGAELAVLDEMLGRARLVTVLGSGGVGKTRFVLEHLARRGADAEMWLVELAPLRDPLAVPEAIASTVGAHDHGADRERARLPDVRSVDRLGGRDVVLVLDNCEHVVDAAARSVRALLDGCPGLRIIATSRQPLNLEGEHQLPLEPLDAEDATRLFIDRASAVRPAFAADGDVISDLCRRLDRLPLAIELAAARVKTLPVTEIAARLDDRFGLLHGADRTNDRHRGLGAAIDWSFDALFEDERRVFCRLSVFAGGATLDAANEVCGADALGIISRLVDKSLVVADTTGAEARFRMLESLREYGLARLAESGDLDGAVTAHRAWCTALAEQAELGVRNGKDELTWLNRLDDEHDNLRAALSRPVPDGGGLRLIAALLLPWWLHERDQEARHWVDTHLAQRGRAAPAVVAKAEAWCGLLASSTGWLEQTGGIEHELTLASERQRRSLAFFDGAGDDLAAAYCRLMLAFNILRRSVVGMGAELAEIPEHAAQMNIVFERHDDHFGLALSHVTASLRSVVMGDLELADALCIEARRHAERTGERYCRARVELIAGMLTAAAGDAEDAYRHIERCMQLHQELGMGREVTSQAVLLANLAEARSQPSLAAQWRRFVADRHGGASHDHLLITAAARNSYGRGARRAGRLRIARKAHEDALERYREAGASSGVAATEVELGYLAAASGEDPTQAGAHHDAALTAAVESRQPAALAVALEGIGASVASRHPADAAALLGAADTLWHSTASGAPPPVRADLADTAAAITQTLGAASYRQAFRRGAGLTEVAAVALARRLRRLEPR